MSKLKNNRGSVLVTTVVISIVLSILVSGLFTFISFLNSNEANAADVDKSFWAAESGLSLGSAWVSSNSMFPTKFGTLTPFADLEINGFLVRVTLTEAAAVGGVPAVLVTSVVYDTSGGETVSSSTFARRISQTVTPVLWGEFATFFDDVEGWNPNKNSGWGGFYRREFVGRFHMNEAIKIYDRPSSSNRTIFRDGKVSVATDYGRDYGVSDTLNYNNYNSGVILRYNSSNIEDSARTIKGLDSIFTDEYDGNADEIEIPTNLTADILAAGEEVILILPPSLDEGEAYNDYRPTLEFVNDGGIHKAKYHYADPVSGDLKTKIYSNYDEKVFIADGVNLNIIGEVEGRTTVATEHGYSIIPVGDITYSDYNESTGEIAEGSENVLGLVSGKRITFLDKWNKKWEGTGESNPSINGGNGTLDITGSLIAVEKDSWSGLDMGGMYWDRSRTMNYNFNLKGNQVMKSWHYPKSGSRGAQGYLKFDHDLRLIDEILPPGYPVEVKTTNGKIDTKGSDWQESYAY